MEQKISLELIKILSRPKIEPYPCDKCKFFKGYVEDKEMNYFGECSKNNVTVQNNGTCSSYKSKNFNPFSWVAFKIRK
jgi:hypothetical protein